MVKSKYLTNQLDWDERIRAMEEDLSNKHYNFLYFKIALNLNDARDSADYDKEQVLIKMLTAFKKGAYKSVYTLIGVLKSLLQ